METHVYNSDYSLIHSEFSCTSNSVLCLIYEHFIFNLIISNFVWKKQVQAALSNWFLADLKISKQIQYGAGKQLLNRCCSALQCQSWLKQVLEFRPQLLELCFLDLFHYSSCKCGDFSSNPELIFSSVISLATKCAMPSFRMHLRAHGMVAMVFKTLDDSQHHQVCIHCVFLLQFGHSCVFLINFVYALFAVKHHV